MQLPPRRKARVQPYKSENRTQKGEREQVSTEQSSRQADPVLQRFYTHTLFGSMSNTNSQLL